MYNFTLKLWKRVILKKIFSQFYANDLIKFSRERSNGKKCPGNEWILLERFMVKQAIYSPYYCNSRLLVMIVEMTRKLENFQTCKEIRAAFYDSTMFKMLKNNPRSIHIPLMHKKDFFY